MIYKTFWIERGSSVSKTGFLVEVKVPLHLWVLDKWLQYFHPHWGWWDRVWSRVLPDYGDPLCFAYCYVWSSYYFQHEQEVRVLDIGYQNLNRDFRKDLE